MRRWTLAMVALALGAAACSAQNQGTVVTIDGLSSRTPADWKEVKPTRPLRAKEFHLPRQGGDPADAEVVISERVGGGAEANIKRWQNQFRPPDGKTIDEVTKIDKFKVGAVSVIYVDITGTYTDPFAKKPEPQANYRMIAVFFESPNGPYTIRMIGPEKTVAHHKKGFDEWLKNFK